MGFWKALGQTVIYTADAIGTAAIRGTVGVAKTASKAYEEYQKTRKRIVKYLIVSWMVHLILWKIRLIKRPL